MTLNNSMSITPSPPGQAKGAKFEHGSVLGGKTRGARVSSQWKSTGNTSRLAFCRVKPTSRDDLIFEVDSNDAQVHQTGDVQGQLFVVVAVAPLEIDGHWNGDRG